MQEGTAFLQLQTQFHENKLAHAFLIETNHIEKSYQSILHFLKIINCPSDFKENCLDCPLCHLFETNNLPNFITIEPDGTYIKKEQILELKQFFQTKPIYSKYNMYVIKNAEKLNSSSANTMLKFIEEPEENIIGFFLTNNKENMIDTIRSRCQIIKDYYADGEAEAIPSIWHAIAVSYFKELVEKKEDTVFYNKDVLMPLIHDRKELFYLFQSLLSIVHKCLEKCINHGTIDDVDLQFLANKDKIFFQKETELILDILDELNYNLNISLVLDRFVLEGSEF